MKKVLTILKTTFKGFSPRRYLDMDDIVLESERNGVHYRLAERTDIVDFLAIERDVYEGDLPWTFSHFEHEIVQNDLAFFVVAETEGKVVGFIGARVINHGQNIHITNLAVRQAFQKRGIASTLIQQIIQLMTALGKGEMTLEVRRDNTQAQAIYRRNGFATEQLLPAYYDDGGDAILMVKKLKNED
ncbi:ribosomal protein S18-alanine N-acetyltransferase [Lactococcus nasutitermitis]|uniref:Ribosomal protein S18-alanine N-acetyltransferase n=1 Tax=Lactococcus nasutitermitis TaxID=1652957 RepID=A0ABV9JG96_9LACT|nr:ribosomal protein S18-alanine N-acetyltransferase [Lactococcus nasutitermitis]